MTKSSCGETKRADRTSVALTRSELCSRWRPRHDRQNVHAAGPGRAALPERNPRRARRPSGGPRLRQARLPGRAPCHRARPVRQESGVLRRRADRRRGRVSAMRRVPAQRVRAVEGSGPFGGGRSRYSGPPAWEASTDVCLEGEASRFLIAGRRKALWRLATVIRSEIWAEGERLTIQEALTNSRIRRLTKGNESR